jgi:parvulin-like peptidyl-prolyl isomerase
MIQNKVRSMCKFLGNIVLGGLFAGISFAQGQAPTPNNPPPAGSVSTRSGSASSEKVILKVGNEQITQGEMDFLISNLNPQAQRSLAAQGRRTLGDQYATLVLLSQQALSHHLDSSPAFQVQLNLQKRQLLAQAAYQELVKQASVNPDEVSKYFSAHQNDFEEAQIREVIVRERPAGAKEGTPGLTPTEAKTRAEAIRKAISSGLDAKKVTEQYQTPNEVLIDADPRTVRHGQMRPEMEKVAFGLKDGEVSPIIEDSQVLVFFQGLGHRVRDLKDVTPQIEESLRQQKVESELSDLKKKTTIWLDENYFSSPSQTAAPPQSSAPTQH